MTEKKKYKILVVDDNRDIVQSLEMLLGRMGHSVEVAYDGVTAIDKVLSNKPEIILLDIGLPKLNGYETAEAIRKINSTSGIMIVAVTGYGQPEDMKKSENAGFDYHYVKPISITDLKEILRRFGKRQPGMRLISM